MPDIITQSFSREEILAMGRSLKRRFGRRISLRKFRKSTGVPVSVIQNLFGGWRRLRALIERDEAFPPFIRNRSNRQIIESLRRHAEERKAEITQADFCRLIGVTRHEIVRRFGSWRRLREAAGLLRRAKQPRTYTNRELLDPLLRYYLRTGELPTPWDIEFHRGKTLLMKLKNRFGAWEWVKKTLVCYVDLYFVTRDPEWRPDPERKYLPDAQAVVEWPAHTAGLDWSPRTGWVHPDKI